MTKIQTGDKVKVRESASWLDKAFRNQEGTIVGLWEADTYDERAPTEYLVDFGDDIRFYMYCDEIEPVP